VRVERTLGQRAGGRAAFHASQERS
jgi:hypothetical protein